MAATRALARLLHVLLLEEERCQRALETALQELHSLERGLVRAAERERAGRQLVAESTRNGALLDRIAGFEEMRSARHLAAVLAVRQAEAASEAAVRREAYQAKRVERRQAETVLRAAESSAAAEAARRSQQSLDEWYRSRQRRASSTPDSAKS